MLKNKAALPLVSVVIPCFNHQDYVQQTIQSVIDQDYSNIELIIIDDGSSDNSVDKIKEMISICEKRFTRFKFKNRPNKGLCATLNEALEWCQGEFLSTVASDDIWLPYKTSRQINLFLDPKNHNVAVISGEMISINTHGKSDSRSSFTPPKEQYYSFLDIYRGHSRINAPTAMIRMHCVKEAGGYNTKVIIEDFYMWLAVTNLGYQILGVDTVFTKYRIHSNNTFSKIEKMNNSRVRILKHFSPDSQTLSETIHYNNKKNFKAASIYQKHYALKLLVAHNFKLLSRDTLPYVIIIFIPKKIFFKSLVYLRFLKKIKTKL